MRLLRLFALSMPLMCSLPLIAAEAEVAARTAENPVVARGKNFEVRRAQLDEAWAIYAAKMSRGGKLPDEPRPSVESKLLNHIVESHILLEKATAQEKDRAASEVEALLANTRKRFQGEDEYKKWLKTTGTTPEAYRRRMIEQRVSELVIEARSPAL